MVCPGDTLKRLSCSSYLSQRLEIAKGLLFHAGPLSPMSCQPLCLYCSLISACSSSPCKLLPCFNLEYSTCHPGVQDGRFPMIPVWLFVLFFFPHICPANQWKCDQKVQRHKGSEIFDISQTSRHLSSVWTVHNSNYSFLPPILNLKVHSCFSIRPSLCKLCRLLRSMHSTFQRPHASEASCTSQLLYIWVSHVHIHTHDRMCL